jgi:hypothetical protein
MTVHDIIPPASESKGALVPLVYEGTRISARNEMLSLTDMWKAAGSPNNREPFNWIRFDGSSFIEAVAVCHNLSHTQVMNVKSGKGGGTFAHWQIAMAYAKYLDPKFHMWCNTIVRSHMEGRNVERPREVISFEMLREAVRQEVVAALAPEMIRSYLASQTLLIRRGKTAGSLWREFGFPPVKGIAVWFGNRLRDLGCAMEHSARAEMGTTTARLFDPDKARAWVENGGRFVIDKRIAERRGQGVLNLVRKPTDEPRPL